MIFSQSTMDKVAMYRASRGNMGSAFVAIEQYILDLIDTDRRSHIIQRLTEDDPLVLQSQVAKLLVKEIFSQLR